MTLILAKRSRIEPTADPTVSLAHDASMSFHLTQKNSYTLTGSVLFMFALLGER